MFLWDWTFLHFVYMMLLVGVGSLVQFFQTRELSWVPLRTYVRHSSKQPWVSLPPQRRDTDNSASRRKTTLGKWTALWQHMAGQLTRLRFPTFPTAWSLPECRSDEQTKGPCKDCVTVSPWPWTVGEAVAPKALTSIAVRVHLSITKSNSPPLCFYSLRHILIPPGPSQGFSGGGTKRTIDSHDSN